MKKAILTLLLLGNVFVVQAASFDCNKAKSQDEKSICKDRVLSLLDTEMSRKYNEILKHLNKKDRENSIDGQNGWLIERKNCGSNTYCLRKLYVEQINNMDEASKR